MFKLRYGCVICGDNCGFLDDGEPCYGCNFLTCDCGAIIPYDIKCIKCGKITKYDKTKIEVKK